MRLDESFQGPRFGLAEPISLRESIDAMMVRLPGLHNEERDCRLCAVERQRAQIRDDTRPVSRRLGEANFVMVSFVALLVQA